MRKAIALTLSACLICLHGRTQESTSPYRISNADAWAAPGILLLAGVGWYVQSRVKSLTATDVQQLDLNPVPSMDRSNLGAWRPSVARGSDIASLAIGVAPLAIFASQHPRDDLPKIALMGAEAGLACFAMVGLTKGIVHRSRPFLYGASAPLDEKLKRDARLSFPSGHTAFTATATFLGAKIFNDYFPESKLRPWVWTFAAMAPAGMGCLRMRAGKHFFTDVAAGYLVGAAAGYWIPRVHRSHAARSLSVTPNFWKGGSGVLVDWRF